MLVTVEGAFVKETQTLFSVCMETDVMEKLVAHKTK
jgi:hypothetical protein